MEHCAGVGKESNPGSSLHPPVSSALVCRARLGLCHRRDPALCRYGDPEALLAFCLATWSFPLFSFPSSPSEHHGVVLCRWCMHSHICSSPAGALRHSAAVFCTHTHTAHGLHALGKINSPITSDCSCSVCDKTAELLSQCVHLPPLCFPGITVMYSFVSILASEQ